MGEIKKKQLLAPHEIKEIFANLDEILDVNETMMAELYMKGSMERKSGDETDSTSLSQAM